MELKYSSEVDNLRHESSHRQKLAKIKHDREIEAIKSRFIKDFDKVKETNNNEILIMKDRFRQRLALINKDHDDAIVSFKAKSEERYHSLKLELMEKRERDKKHLEAIMSKQQKNQSQPIAIDDEEEECNHKKKDYLEANGHEEDFEDNTKLKIEIEQAKLERETKLKNAIRRTESETLKVERECEEKIEAERKNIIGKFCYLIHCLMLCFAVAHSIKLSLFKGHQPKKKMHCVKRFLSTTMNWRRC